MAVAFLLKQYATNSAIKEALENLRSLAQKPGQTEDEFHTLLFESHECSGYQFDINKRIPAFINGISQKPRPSLHLFREE